MLNHLADIESDLSAIHHLWIDVEAGQFAGLNSRRFFQMVERLPAYQGVLQMRVMAQQQDEQAQPVVGTVTGGDSGDSGGGFNGVKVIPLTPEMAAHGMGPLGLDGVVDYATSA